MSSLTSALYHHLTDPISQVSLASVALAFVLVAYFVLSFTELSALKAAKQYAQFAYSCFFKPHTGDGTGNQQDALESFYKSQASVYDATRTRLLQGRQDMLALVAAQVKYRVETGQIDHKPIWVDIGGGTGWNIEQMGQQVDVPTFFHAVYLVDLSSSLCEIARQRFKRLGWNNVHVICEDARIFRLSDYEAGLDEKQRDFSIGKSASYEEDGRDTVGADLLTLSYSLSMIPEFHPAIDSVANLLAPNGIVGVVDFYVQNQIEFAGRNYIGGAIDRHCMWISRVFWRTWFELDRVNLESARRDYIEYKFGTILSTNRRCHLLGFRIPYYIFVGCTRQTSAMLNQVAQVESAVTESPFISALDLHSQTRSLKNRRSSSAERRSKAFDTAVVNLAASLPLPAAYYQNNKTRVYYDESLPKHKQFGDEYIYAFTWEDSRTDARLLKITGDDTILALTSAGDNILSYALERPRRIHAVDLNPAQNHLLELKVAAFRGLEYQDFFKLFGSGKHEDFHSLLLERLSPHLSSQAFDYWLHVGPKTFDPKGNGLYYTGGSRHAIKLVAWLGSLLGVRNDMRRLCEVSTLAEQREIWHKRVRRVLLSQLLAYFVIGSERFLWKALGVPGEQRAMIEDDFKRQAGDRSKDVKIETTSAEQLSGAEGENNHVSATKSGQAIWNYGVQTLDPVANDTLVSEDNHYYLVCLQGEFHRSCPHLPFNVLTFLTRPLHPPLPPRLPEPEGAHEALRSRRPRQHPHPHRRAGRGLRSHAARGSDYRRPDGLHGLVQTHWSRVQGSGHRCQPRPQDRWTGLDPVCWVEPLVHSDF
jgi:betaine lipid synthase